MAGWKLRKDKTQAEAPTAEPPAAAEPATANGGAAIYSSPPTGEETPATQWETQRQTPVGAGPMMPGVEGTPDQETASGPHFEEEDGPLKLIDYSAPFSEDLLPLSSASASPIIAAPPPDLPLEELPATERPSAEMPTLAPPSFDTSMAEPEDTASDFTSTLRMSREELAAVAPPPPSGIPPVAPFVLDSPLVSPASTDTPPRLVVRMGRLSAAFDLTKEVTVIGRPDSEMHYYPDVEIDLDDAVSRRHAEIIRRGDAYSLVDTGSTNGTLLNGETLPPHEERVLTHGDRIRVGERTEIIFE